MTKKIQHYQDLAQVFEERGRIEYAQYWRDRANQLIEEENGRDMSTPQIISFVSGLILAISGSPVLCVLGLVLMFGGIRHVLR
jgi:hypothetical protein